MHNPIREAVSHIRAWVLSRRVSLRQIARHAGLDHKTVALAADPDWRPRSDTLADLWDVQRKLDPDFAPPASLPTPAQRRRAA